MRLKIVILACWLLSLFTPTLALAQTADVETNALSAPILAPDSFYRARVLEITAFGVAPMDGKEQEWQTLKIELLNGAEKGTELEVNNGKDFVAGIFQKYSAGDTVVISKPGTATGAEESAYYIVDRYRGRGLIVVALIFFALAIYFGRQRGATSIVGMLLSVAVIFYFIIPRVLSGADPLLTCVIGSVAILLLSLYSAHGFNKRTSIALVSTLLALGMAIIIDLIFVRLAGLTGAGTEEAFYLQLDVFNIDLRGLLMGGIIIGVLGVLDDVTTGQAAAIEEIHSANPALTFVKLYQKGLSIGREHIASLINTLVLAYAGASFPLLLLFSSQKTMPLWFALNSNFIAEEIVRTLVGSAALVLAVPLTTLLAAAYYSKKLNLWSGLNR